MTAALVTLNPAAQVALVSCEQRIERGLRGFREIGEALAEIRDSRLYKATHGTFEDYCEQRWNLSRRHSYQLIESAQAVCSIEHTGLPLPEKESQARALAGVPEPDRADVWREANERTDGKPTAKVVTDIAKERSAPTADPERKPLGIPTPEPPAVDSPTVPAGGSGSTSPEPERHPSIAPEPVTSKAAEELRAEMLRDSERRTAVASIRSVLTYMTSRVLTPAQLAQDYVIALSEFTAADLRFAAKTMAALADLKEQ